MWCVMRFELNITFKYKRVVKTLHQSQNIVNFNRIKQKHDSLFNKAHTKRKRFGLNNKYILFLPKVA